MTISSISDAIDFWVHNISDEVLRESTPGKELITLITKCSQIGILSPFPADTIAHVKKELMEGTCFGESVSSIYYDGYITHQAHVIDSIAFQVAHNLRCEVGNAVFRLHAAIDAPLLPIPAKTEGQVCLLEESVLKNPVSAEIGSKEAVAGSETLTLDLARGEQLKEVYKRLLEIEDIPFKGFALRESFIAEKLTGLDVLRYKLRNYIYCYITVDINAKDATENGHQVTIIKKRKGYILSDGGDKFGRSVYTTQKIKNLFVRVIRNTKYLFGDSVLSTHISMYTKKVQAVEESIAAVTTADK